MTLTLTCTFDGKFDARRIEPGSVNAAFLPERWPVTVVAEAFWSTCVGTALAIRANRTAHTDLRDIVAGHVEPVLGGIVCQANVFAYGCTAGF